MTQLHRAVPLALTALLASACCYPSVIAKPTPGFWGPGDFEGSYDRPGEPPINAQTRYVGDIVFANLPAAVAAAVLPSDLQLATNTGAKPGLHPIVLVFGSQTNPSSIIPPINGAPDYHEMILLIPFVQKVGGQKKWHNYVVRMYLDWQMGVDGGNLIYGYRKELGVLVRGTPATQPPEFTFDVSQPNAARLHAEVTGLSAWMDDSAAQTALPNYQAMKMIFDMPVLGTWPPSYGTASPYVCSYFIWKWDAPAQVRSASTQLRFMSEFVPNMTQWVGQGTMSSLADGDWGVDGLNWQLTTPKACSF